MSQDHRAGHRAGRCREGRPDQTRRVFRDGQTIEERVIDRPGGEVREALVRDAEGRIDHVQAYKVHRIVRRDRIGSKPVRPSLKIPDRLEARQLKDTPPAPGLAPIDVEQFAVWALRHQKAHQDVAVDPRRYLAGDSDAWDNTAGFVELGTVVDASPRYMAATTHPDADRVAARISGLDPLLRHLVTEHARRGTRPELVAINQVRLFPFLSSNLRGPRRPLRQHATWDKGHNWGSTPLYQYPSEADVDASRAVWRAWWYGLQLLAECLRADHETWRRNGMRWLKDWWPLDPAASPAPWG